MTTPAIARIAALALAAWFAGSPHRHRRKARRRRSAARSPPTGKARWRACWSAPRRPGSTITVTVVSDAERRLRIPRGPAGAGQLPIERSGRRAMRSTARARSSLPPARPRRRDLKLKPAPVQFEQLTNAELLVSAPGPARAEAQSAQLQDCHSLHRIFGSKHTRDDFMKVFERMGTYYPGASDLQPQRLVGGTRRPAVNPALADSFAGYLEALNLSSSAGAPLRVQDHAARRPAAPRASSSPNTICRGKRSSRTT